MTEETEIELMEPSLSTSMTTSITQYAYHAANELPLTISEGIISTLPWIFNFQNKFFKTKFSKTKISKKIFNKNSPLNQYCFWPTARNFIILFIVHIYYCFNFCNSKKAASFVTCSILSVADLYNCDGETVLAGAVQSRRPKSHYRCHTI